MRKKNITPFITFAQSLMQSADSSAAQRGGEGQQTIRVSDCIQNK
ncbi:MAG: hypothetical protein ACFN4D_00950 [Cardiobacterium sp.]